MYKIPLYVFPVGGRGDFLMSILHGNVLADDWDQITITKPGVQESVSEPLKIHNFGSNLHGKIGKFSIGPNDIEKFYSIRISVTDQQDLFDTAYLSAVKRSNNIPLTAELLKQRVSMTQSQEAEFCDYDHKFQHVIEFHRLFDIDFLQDLRREISKKSFTDYEVERINHNIELNQNLLQTNPFVLTSDNNVVPKN